MIEETNKIKLPCVCPDHPTAQIKHKYEKIYPLWYVGVSPTLPYSVTVRKLECAVCGRELAPE